MRNPSNEKLLIKSSMMKVAMNDKPGYLFFVTLVDKITAT